jgi:arogenate dehydrogenase (NADP+)
VIIGIVGLGLIGGSLGLDLCRLNHRVWGVSRSAQTCAEAVQMSAIHYGSTDFHAIPDLSHTDIIVLCTPIDRIIPCLRELAGLVSTKTIITDVASVKASIVPSAMQIYARFIGSHPMAGKESQGIRSAELGLFQGRTCVVCPGESQATDTVKQLWQSVGMTICECTPTDHDRAVAWISHLPVMISAALIHTCQNEPNLELRKLAQTLASSGFRDTSRVGGGNPHLGLCMAQCNREQLLHALTIYQTHLAQIKEWIELENWQALLSLLAQTALDRQLFL